MFGGHEPLSSAEKLRQASGFDQPLAAAGLRVSGVFVSLPQGGDKPVESARLADAAILRAKPATEI